MAKPQINTIKSYDANFDITITISWTGLQSYANRIIIYDNSTLNKVYDNVIQTMNLIHTIPAYTLQNGKSYIIECQVFDSDGNESLTSNKYLYKTYTTPLFFFDSISDGEEITTTSYNANVIYSQEESEQLYYYKFVLYNSNKNKIYETENFYNIDNITHTYRGLETESIYYIRCYGCTVNGLEVDTGYIKIFINCASQKYYARIYVENDPNTSGINYHTNLKIILPDKDDYTFDKDKIDLTEGDITYSEGFEISGNFVLKLSGTNLYRNGDILLMGNKKFPFYINLYNST